jgi:hypothetical protein
VYGSGMKALNDISINFKQRDLLTYFVVSDSTDEHEVRDHVWRDLYGPVWYIKGLRLIIAEKVFTE